MEIIVRSIALSRILPMLVWVPGMKVRTTRFLGDAFIITSWCVYLLAFFKLWAPLLPEWLVGLVVLFAVVVGHSVGTSWKRRVTGHTPVAARWLPEFV